MTGRAAHIAGYALALDVVAGLAAGSQSTWIGWPWLDVWVTRLRFALLARYGHRIQLTANDGVARFCFSGGNEAGPRVHRGRAKPDQGVAATISATRSRNSP